MLIWLAHFHATFLGQAPTRLWASGTYWHLETRPDEWRTMQRGPLRDAAGRIDARLRAARFQTLVHGDAKPANFLVNGTEVTAVDFQYVGGGIGVQDVAYLLAGSSHSRGLDLYFDALRPLLAPEIADDLEAEWRALYPVAWADFHRFLMGWAPGRGVSREEQAMTDSVL